MACGEEARESCQSVHTRSESAHACAARALGSSSKCITLIEEHLSMSVFRYRGVGPDFLCLRESTQLET